MQVSRWLMVLQVATSNWVAIAILAMVLVIYNAIVWSIYFELGQSCDRFIFFAVILYYGMSGLALFVGFVALVHWIVQRNIRCLLLERDPLRFQIEFIMLVAWFCITIVGVTIVSLLLAWILHLVDTNQCLATCATNLFHLFGCHLGSEYYQFTKITCAKMQLIGIWCLV